MNRPEKELYLYEDEDYELMVHNAYVSDLEKYCDELEKVLARAINILECSVGPCRICNNPDCGKCEGHKLNTLSGWLKYLNK